MKVLAPLTVTAAMLTSSTLAETEYAAWSSATTYALADRRIYSHRIYESLQATNLNHQPDTSPTWWVDVGPTNRWAMFDGAVSTASADTTDIEVTLTPGAVLNAVACIAAVGQEVTVVMMDGATEVYSQTQSLDSTPISDWEDYFFADQVLAGELVFEGLPRYLSATVTVTVAAAAGAASIGVLVLGTLHDIGSTESNASAGITDYSRKETDDFGTTALTVRSYAKRASVRVLLDTAELRRVQALLAALRATPCVWIGATDTALFSPLVLFGWYRSFGIDIPGPVLSHCSLDIEGLT